MPYSRSSYFTGTPRQTEQVEYVCFFKLDNHLYTEDKAGGKILFTGHYLLCIYQNVICAK